MIELTKESFSEVYDIINHLETAIYEKIPKKFIEVIKANRDEKYISKIDYSKDINNQEISKGARAVLAIIYRDFVCSKEKKAELLEKDKIELQKIEEENAKKYDIDNIFKKKEIEKTENKQQENTSLVKPKKQNIITKFIEFIKKIFNRR